MARFQGNCKIARKYTLILEKEMASRKELIEEFNKVETKYKELSYSLYKRYIKIVERYRDNKAKLEQYLDECPNCNSKLMFYQALRELSDKEEKKLKRQNK